MTDPGYPILLNIVDKQCLVIGGGTVATRKVQGLLEAGARVTVISPAITPELQALVADGQVEWVEALYQRDMLNAYMPLLVIATTDNARVNETVAQDARRIRSWVNVVDGHDDSDFSNMAVIQRPPMTVALSSNNASPALLRHLKAELNTILGEEYAVLAQWLGDIRQPVKEEIEAQSDRKNLYQQVIDSEVLTLLRAGEAQRARDCFDQIVDTNIKQTKAL